MTAQVFILGHAERALPQPIVASNGRPFWTAR